MIWDIYSASALRAPLAGPVAKNIITGLPAFVAKDLAEIHYDLLLLAGIDSYRF